MAKTPAEKIWFNGDIMPWQDAKVHVMTHAIHYGSSVFEGVRAYNTPDQERACFVCKNIPVDYLIRPKFIV